MHTDIRDGINRWGSISLPCRRVPSYLFACKKVYTGHPTPEVWAAHPSKKYAKSSGEE